MTIRIDGTNTAANPGITGTDTDTGLQFGTDEVNIVTGGTTRATVDSSGRLLVGATSVGNANADELTLENSSGAAGVTIRAAANFNSNVYFADPGSATIGRIEYVHNGDTMRFHTFGSEVMRNTSTGELQFNSGYGSVATAFGVRAWVNFNGTGTVAIRGNGNVSSITDEGTGLYQVNFSSAMPDGNYAVVGSSGEDDNGTTPNHHGFRLQREAQQTTEAVIATANTSGTPTDHQFVCCIIAR